MIRTRESLLLATLFGCLIACGPVFNHARADDVQASGEEQTAGSRQRSTRAYKPAERRRAEAEAAAADAAAGNSYEAELQAAKEQRDRELKELEGETDRRTLEKRKSEIFAKYAQILAAMRDKYNEQNPPAADPEQTPAKSQAKRTTKKAPPPLPAQKPRTRSGRGAKSSDAALEEAQRKLQDENDRHATRLDELNAQLQSAESAGNKRDVRKFQKAIDKENTSYRAKKALLERRVEELGGTISGVNGDSEER
jgi:hypothetical protein